MAALAGGMWRRGGIFRAVGVGTHSSAVATPRAVEDDPRGRGGADHRHSGASHRGANHLFSRRTANLSIGELETDSDEAVPTASRLPPVLPKAPKSKREG